MGSVASMNVRVGVEFPLKIKNENTEVVINEFLENCTLEVTSILQPTEELLTKLHEESTKFELWYGEDDSLSSDEDLDDILHFFNNYTNKDHFELLVYASATFNDLKFINLELISDFDITSFNLNNPVHTILIASEYGSIYYEHDNTSGTSVAISQHLLSAMSVPGAKIILDLDGREG